MRLETVLRPHPRDPHMGKTPFGQLGEIP
jgi:hypothetical protein